jgi:hypothetical protein
MRVLANTTSFLFQVLKRVAISTLPAAVTTHLLTVLRKLESGTLVSGFIARL